MTTEGRCAGGVLAVPPFAFTRRTNQRWVPSSGRSTAARALVAFAGASATRIGAPPISA
jgi:hypothetical protein